MCATESNRGSTTAAPREPLVGEEAEERATRTIRDGGRGVLQLPAAKSRRAAPSAGWKPRGDEDPAVNGAERRKRADGRDPASPEAKQPPHATSETSPSRRPWEVARPPPKP